MADQRAPAIHVVAGVLRDEAGRVLLAQRTAAQDLAGCWEFPGGKREPGESPEQSLVRELHEELGIRIDTDGCTPLIAVPQDYAAQAGAASGKRIVLDVYEVARFDGQVRGMEQQALRWVAPGQLADYPMPPADRPVLAALLAPAHYLITPEPGDDDRAFLDCCERALAAGVRRVQLRARHLSNDRREAIATQLLQRCHAVGADLLINGDIKLAVRLEVGVHLQAHQLMSLDARPLPGDRLVAASCHDAVQLRRAAELGLDFVVLGPVAATASHPDAEPIGWSGFAALRERVDLPIYALGGLGPDQLASARAHGAQGIAGIRAYWPDAN